MSALEVDIQLHDGWSDIEHDSDDPPSPNDNFTPNFAQCYANVRWLLITKFRFIGLNSDNHCQVYCSTHQFTEETSAIIQEYLYSQFPAAFPVSQNQMAFHRECHHHLICHGPIDHQHFKDLLFTLDYTPDNFLNLLAQKLAEMDHYWIPVPAAVPTPENLPVAAVAPYQP